MSHPLLVVAGEVSGDMHAGAVINALKARDPELAAFGIGGDRLAGEGMDLLVHARDMAVFGPFAALARYPFFKKVFKQVIAEVRVRRPAVALLVDYGGFNLRLAKALKAEGVKVVYFISPQVWASRPGRIAQMAERLHRLMVIFPFEPRVFEGSGLRVDYVGHPLVDAIAAHRAAEPAEVPWGEGARVAILPGSRRQEVEAILPPMLSAAGLVSSLQPAVSFIIAVPDEDAAGWVRAVMEKHPAVPAGIEVVVGATRSVLSQARAGWVASGTATLEAALLGCPAVVVYKTSPLFFALARRIVKIPYIGMVNLVAEAPVCPELIQGEAAGPGLAQALLPLVEETEERTRMLAGYATVRERLGPGGAIGRAADILVEELGA